MAVASHAQEDMDRKMSQDAHYSSFKWEWAVGVYTQVTADTVGRLDTR